MAFWLGRPLANLFAQNRVGLGWRSGGFLASPTPCKCSCANVLAQLDMCGQAGPYQPPQASRPRLGFVVDGLPIPNPGLRWAAWPKMCFTCVRSLGYRRVANESVSQTRLRPTSSFSSFLVRFLAPPAPPPALCCARLASSPLGCGAGLRAVGGRRFSEDCTKNWT